ncbi:MAG: GTP 3',8-cyclase MoaA [Betaproteobacteria bacterium]|nr:GTP 3',8-cyclase MoaA [Betaproteobacteria bacterium]
MQGLQYNTRSAIMKTTSPLLTDTLGRPLRDLRISVTDRCNFRCTYCMPREIFGPDHAFLPRPELLSFEEVSRLARLFHGLGVNKIRLTGGEPLLRKQIESLIGQLAGIPGLDLTLTTNGALLARKAQALKDAGLRRVTVSLDALDDPTFMRMNDADYTVAQVLEGIEAAQRAGFAPIKVNAVIQRNVNEHAVVELARHFRGSGVILRFIEFMDVGATNGWRMDNVVGAAEILGLLQRQWSLEPVDPNYPGEVAERYRYRDGSGEIGLIASVTQPFCQGCTRLRLSTDGRLYTCLFATEGVDIKTPLRAGADDESLVQTISELWQRRSDRYSEIRSQASQSRHKIEMSYIGG